MTARDPVLVKLDEERQVILEIQAFNLSFKAHKIMRDKGISPDNFVLFCIDLKSKHKDIAKMHDPDIVLPETFAEGTFYIYQGSAESRSFCAKLFSRFPSLEDQLEAFPSSDRVKCFVLNEGGCSTYGIEPIPLS
jgi:hypothetical protein